MNDFVLVWHDMWIGLLGNSGCINLYHNGDVIWCVNYVDLVGYLLYTLLVIWLITLSVRLLRKLVCGVVR